MSHVLITGASRRLGLYLTGKYLEDNWQVTAVTRSSSSALDNLKCANLEIVNLDYQDELAIREFCTQMAHQTVDLVIHNASLFLPDPTDMGQYATNAKQLNDIHVVLPGLMNSLLFISDNSVNTRNIIHITDIYAQNPKENYSLYCASKAAAQNLSLAFAKKLAPTVRVNCIAPGALQFLPEHSESEKHSVLDGSLLKVEAGFEPMLQTIRFIVNNPFITGSIINVDGGRSICR